MREVLILASIAMLVAGCTASAPIGRIHWPSASLMQPCDPAVHINPGDDLVKKDAELRGEYVACSSKVRGLQSYVRPIIKG